MTEHLNLLLPVALVAMAFILKLFVDQSVDTPRIIQSLYELPVSVIFLSLTFITAYIISSVNNIGVGLCYIYFYIIFAVVIIFLWRRSLRSFEMDHYIRSALLFIINASISGYLLYQAVSILIPRATP